MTWGEYRRAQPRLNVLRGFAGNEPQSITHSAPPKLNVNIYSGQVIVLDANGQWVLADLTTAGVGSGKVPHFAYHDAIWVNGVLQTDTDVKSSGLLLGLSCLGDFEIQTAFFVTGDVYAHGDAVGLSAAGANSGWLDKSAYAPANPLVGVCTRGGVENIAAINTESVRDANGAVNVLNLVTRWRPITT